MRRVSPVRAPALERRANGFVHRNFAVITGTIVLVLTSAHCKRDEPAVTHATPLAAEQSVEKPTPNEGLDAVVEGCLAEHPKSGELGNGIDAQRAWEICMDQSGNQNGLCDTMGMITANAAACIARGKGLPEQETWRVRLEFSPAPRPQVVWIVALADSSQKMALDAHTGELIAREGRQDEANAKVNEQEPLDTENESPTAESTTSSSVPDKKKK